MKIVKKPDNLFTGIVVLLCSLLPIIALSIYEISTKNYFGYIGITFVPQILVSFVLIISGFVEDDKEK